MPDGIEAATRSGDARYVFFGGADERRSVSQFEFQQEVANPKAYRFIRTDIPAVLNDVRSAPLNELAIVVTDLFFNNRELGSGGTGRIAQSLHNLVRQGRSVAIMGVVSPFKGEIYDIPPHSAHMSYFGTRPVFAIIIGPISSVTQFITKTRETLLVDHPARKINAVVFTTAPLPPHKMTITGYDVRKEDAKEGRIKETVLGAHTRYAHVIKDSEADLLWQGHLSSADPDGSINLTLPLNEIYWSDTVRPRSPSFDAAATSRLNMFAGIAGATADGERCNALWQTIDPAPQLVEVRSANADSINLSIAPGQRSADLQHGKVYFAQIVLNSPAPDRKDLPQWIRDWSFDDAQGEVLVSASQTYSAPKMFPVYRLDTLASAILDAQNENLHDNVIADVNIAFILE
jgi:hypothetical protein